MPPVVLIFRRPSILEVGLLTVTLLCLFLPN
jgi:hypothetical protein